jgi:hypothetical protein
MQKPPEIFQRIGNALKEMRFPLVEPTKSLSSESLHDAHINVSVVMMQEC